MSSYAIVIGISHYKSPKEGGLKQLDGAIPDAEAVAKWLKDSKQVDVLRKKQIKEVCLQLVASTSERKVL